MARKIRKKPKNYPYAIVFDENLEGVAEVFDLVGLNLPAVFVAIKGTSDHVLAHAIREAVFFTADKNWLKRQPPYQHGGIIVVRVGNLPLKEKASIIMRFLHTYHIRNKILDTLRDRRFKLTKTTLWEIPIEGEPIRVW